MVAFPEITAVVHSSAEAEIKRKIKIKIRDKEERRRERIGHNFRGDLLILIRDDLCS